MKILAIDYGLARTGLAVCDISETLAVPAGTIFEKGFHKLIEAIEQKISQTGAGLLVLGYPKNMNGTVGERAQAAQSMAEVLRQKTGLEVILWDERYSTVSAIRMMNDTNTRGKKRKQTLDQAAAVLILQSFLDYRSNQRKKEAAD